MAIPAGTRIGGYEIVALLGAGGMGEVYRARDAKLGRDVALKVLPPALAQDSDYIARFQREAQVLASLNHPNIAAIYGLEENAIVMELVEGGDLRGPLPPDDALKIARQIAEALEAAHEKGIVHRDLKPANIKITPDGAVKVLDFGLAKTTEAARTDISNSPTLTLRSTQVGMILGTAAYMAPEQARAQSVDRRADIWAYGAVLYEILAGKPAFAGDTIADILGAVVMREPDWGALPPATPPHVVELLRRCLTKDRKQRLQAIGEARIAIDAPPKQAIAPAVPRHRRPLLWMLTTGAGFLAAGGFAFLYWSSPAPKAQPARFTISPNAIQVGGAVAVSPDGRYLAFAGSDAGGRRLYLRALDSLQSRPLAGTEDGTAPIWSPDSRSLAFVTKDNLKWISIGGEDRPQNLATVPLGRTMSGAWGVSGDILLGVAQGGILRVPARGGVPQPVTTLAPGTTAHSSPRFLPDGRHFVYVEYGARRSRVFVRDLLTGAQSQLLDAASPSVVYARGSKAGTGYVIFIRNSTLTAHRLDNGGLKLTGEPMSLGEGLVGPLSASDNGVLAYVASADQPDSQLLWVDRQGKVLNTVGPPGSYQEVQFTRDGRTAVLSLGDRTDRSRRIWTLDLERGVTSRMNPTAIANAQDYAMAVSPDSRIAYSVTTAEASGDIYIRQASGAGPQELLLRSPDMKHPNDWSHDGRFLIYDDHSPDNRQDLWVLPLGGGKPIPFLTTPADETLAQFSPDGKWIAYSSDESGRREVWVQGFTPDRVPAAGGGKWQISNAGGWMPRWRRDGNELYYLSLKDEMMAVPVKTNPAFAPGAPSVLFEKPLAKFGGYAYDVTADGSRFLVNAAGNQTASNQIMVLLNWDAGLK